MADLSYNLPSMTSQELFSTNWPLGDASLTAGFQAAALWDWSAGNVAIAGGIVSGLASGGMAYLIFRQGLRSERQKIEAQETARRSELAFSALWKLRDWLDSGEQVCRTIDNQLKDHAKEISEGTPKFGPIQASVDSLHEPERVSLAEVSFLASQNKTELIDKVFEIQRWGYHVLVLMRESSRMRLEWDEWVGPNVVQNTLEVDGKRATGVLREEARQPASMKAVKMNGLIDGIVTGFEETVAEHQKAISDYTIACKSQYSGAFPNVEIRYGN